MTPADRKLLREAGPWRVAAAYYMDGKHYRFEVWSPRHLSYDSHLAAAQREAIERLLNEAARPAKKRRRR